MIKKASNIIPKVVVHWTKYARYTYSGGSMPIPQKDKHTLEMEIQKQISAIIDCAFISRKLISKYNLEVSLNINIEYQNEPEPVYLTILWWKDDKLTMRLSPYSECNTWAYVELKGFQYWGEQDDKHVQKAILTMLDDRGG